MSKTNAICSKCYSRKLLKGVYAKTCTKPYEENSKLLSSRLLFDRELPKIKTNIFRFHSHGELINENHLLNYFHIAELNPECTFTLWSKRIELIKDYIKFKPKNVITIYSTPKINVKKPRRPKGFDRVFSVYTAEFAHKNNININFHANCKECLSCYTIKNKKRYINEVIKNEQNKYKKLLSKEND